MGCKYSIKNGLNTVHEPVINDSINGGFKLTTIRDICIYSSAKYIREVSIPLNETNWVKNPISCPDSWLTSSILSQPRMPLSDINTWLYLFAIGGDTNRLLHILIKNQPIVFFELINKTMMHCEGFDAISIDEIDIDKLYYIGIMSGNIDIVKLLINSLQCTISPAIIDWSLIYLVSEDDIYTLKAVLNRFNPTHNSVFNIMKSILDYGDVSDELKAFLNNYYKLS